MKGRSRFLLLGILIILNSANWAFPNWPQFRGAGSRGIGPDGILPDQWSSTENIAWKTDIPGRGWSSPIVWEDKVFLTTVINSGVSEKPRKGFYVSGNRPEAPTTLHTWKVYCLDLVSGKINWEYTVHEALPETGIHIKNSFASETPVTDGDRVYFYFGNVGLFVFDPEGKELWSKRFKPHFTRYGWGTAASPALHRDRLYIVNDNEEDSWLLALDKYTGEEIWRQKRERESNWSSPYVWENHLRTEIIILATKRVRSYDLDGRELWSLTGMSSITTATPYAADGLLYVSSGARRSRQRPIYAIRPGATGDISIDETQSSSEFIAWCQWRSAPYITNTLLYRDQLYVLLDHRGLLSSLDPKTGAFHFEEEKIPIPRLWAGFSSSPWAYDDKIFCLNEDGDTFVFQAGKSFKLLHVNSLAEDDMCMATPAIAGDCLLIRSSARIYCIKSGATL